MITLVLVLAVTHFSQSQRPPLRGPPQFELNPQYSDSYLPASMQIIAYLTEMMKYDLKPTSEVTTAKPTTARPTPPHNPGLYAPNKPPGPSAYLARSNLYGEYLHRAYLSSNDQSDIVSITNILKKLDPNLHESAVQDLDLLGQGPNDLHRLVNGLEEDSIDDEDDVRAQKFSEKFDDSEFRAFLDRQKKVPPTRAYVTLLSLYDLLNKESKKQGLNRFNGYSESIVKELSDTSSGTSANQLKYVLDKIVAKQSTKDRMILTKISSLSSDINDANSYINMALRYIPPLPFQL